MPPTRRSQPPEQRLGRNIHSHQAVAPIERCQIEVGGPDDLDSVDVHQLVVEDLFEEGHFAGARREVAQVETGRLQDDPGVLDGVDGASVDKGQPTADPDDEAGHRRVGLLTRPPADDVAEPPDLGSGLVPHGASHDAGQGHEGITDGPVSQQALAPLASPGTADPAPMGRRTSAGVGRVEADGGRRCTALGRFGRGSGGKGKSGETTDHGSPLFVECHPATVPQQHVAERRPPLDGGGRARANRTGRGTLHPPYAHPSARWRNSPSGIDQSVHMCEGECGDAPGLLGGSPRFIGHTSFMQFSAGFLTVSGPRQFLVGSCTS